MGHSAGGWKRFENTANYNGGINKQTKKKIPFQSFLLLKCTQNEKTKLKSIWRIILIQWKCVNNPVEEIGVLEIVCSMKCILVMACFRFRSLQQLYRLRLAAPHKVLYYEEI